MLNAFFEGQVHALEAGEPETQDDGPTTEDMDALPDEYRHEPEMGLAAGDDGLDLVRRMLAEAADYLTEDGVLVIEVGNSMVHVMAEWPEVDFEWVKFRHGGHGVFVLSAEQCRHFQSLFAESL